MWGDSTRVYTHERAIFHGIFKTAFAKSVLLLGKRRPENKRGGKKSREK